MENLTNRHSFQTRMGVADITGELRKLTDVGGVCDFPLCWAQLGATVWIHVVFLTYEVVHRQT